MIDLRSDTVTRPSKEMKDAMVNAKLGDDVFQDDPTVIDFEKRTASMFGKEAGLFCPSGTMSNQIALMVHLKPGDEVITSREAHIYNYEGGGVARNAGASMRLIERTSGLINVEDVKKNINPDDIHYPISRLVSLENTSNRGGGVCYDLDDIKEIYNFCKPSNIPIHLDGARLFNAMVKTGVSSKNMGKYFESISLCFSKGLGTPLGSVLIGSKPFIHKARRIRKVLGGGMRQVGMVAAAGLYALDNNIERLNEDHSNAIAIGDALSSCSWVGSVMPVETNIVVANLKAKFSNVEFVEKLKNKGVLAIPFGNGRVRMVTHLDISSKDIDQVIDSVKF
jgi:threonine aldolase